MVRPASTKSNQRPPAVEVPATSGFAVFVVLAALAALAAFGLGEAVTFATVVFLDVAAAFLAAAAALTAVAEATAVAGVVIRLTVPGVGVVDQPHVLPSKAHDWPGSAAS